MNQITRTFEAKNAVRESVPLLIGLMGPSGGGKTYSALRLATGIQRVTGGEIYGIDTEARRMLHYADRFPGFKHIEFGAPFGPSDYLAAIRYAVAQGAKVVIVDSMSHEHEGPGGVLEMHDRELDRLTNGDRGKRDRMNMLAWAKPKQERRAMINGILQLNANFIFCFRAKEKVKMVPGKQPTALGWMPIAGEEFVYEMTTNCLLLPHADGVPTWRSEYPGERQMMKLPEQFKQLFANPQPLSEDMGESFARWSTGGAATETETTRSFEGAPAASPATIDMDGLEAKAGKIAGNGVEAFRDWWKTLSTGERNVLKPKIAKLQALAEKADDPFAAGADEPEAPPTAAEENPAPVPDSEPGDAPTTENEAAPAAWSVEQCRAFGRDQQQKGMSRKAAVPPELRSDEQRSAEILAGFDEAKEAA